MMVDNKSNNSFYMHFEISAEIHEAFNFGDCICIGIDHISAIITQIIIFNNMTTSLQLYHRITIEYYSKLFMARCNTRTKW